MPSLRFPYHQGLLIFFLMLGHQDFPNLKETSFTIIFICIYYIQHCLITLFPFPSLFHFHHSNSCSILPHLSSILSLLSFNFPHFLPLPHFLHHSIHILPGVIFFSAMHQFHNHFLPITLTKSTILRNTQSLQNFRQGVSDPPYDLIPVHNTLRAFNHRPEQVF